MSSNNVTYLPGVPTALDGAAGRQEAVVERLKGLLADAESGEIVSIAYVAIRRGGTMMKRSWVGDSGSFATGYGISMLQHEFLAACSRDGA